MPGLYIQGCLQARQGHGASMKNFILGVVVATAICAGILSLVEIPEYTIIHHTRAVCT